MLSRPHTVGPRISICRACRLSAERQWLQPANSPASSPHISPRFATPSQVFRISPVTTRSLATSQTFFRSNKPPQGHSSADATRGRFAKAATYHPPGLDPATVSEGVNRVLNAFLGPVGIHTEKSTLTALRALAQIHVRPSHDGPERHSEDTTSVRSQASQLLGLGNLGWGRSTPSTADAPNLQTSPLRRSQEVVNIISEAAYKIVTEPAVILTPAVLSEYVRLQARLGRPETLPEVLHLYATKPVPRLVSGQIQYDQPNPDKAANAVDPAVADVALNAAIEAKNLEAAIGVVENTYSTKAFRRAKLIKKALLPGLGIVGTPAAIYIGATELAKLQSSLEPRIATGFAFVGALVYVGCTATLGMVAHFTANDQMKRVTWVPGTPLRYRWLREDERAALDKIACSFGFSEEHRWGEEEGEEFQFLREYVLTKSMRLDAVELMPGMN